ncbi:hypothetical protein P691DRAFT_772449 [Macrolepiota fuliginosa MF-IS2]|uniref:RRM domain-containing protein n=1 Tax=Macrolepiota fuliginosa MF-IS2 TaxID=1400762 RepID=A0A9P5XM70_9AGAR|nr:hypothetical protein P691DRAFT_772449 [Macrolepiota fuliginosa MF-IS2]
MFPSVLRQAVRTTTKAARPRSEVLENTRQIVLTNVPRTAAPADIRREINKAGVRGVSEIAIDYEYFKPAERAILTLVSGDYLKPNLGKLKNLAISGIPVSSDYYVADIQKRPRMRGHEGRAEAAMRGALTGHGPNAGVVNNELTVTLAGLPARTTMNDVEIILEDFKVAQSKKGLPQIVKLPLPPDAFSMTSRFLVTMASVAEAHRVVRELHSSYLKVYGESLVTAKIIN